MVENLILSKLYSRKIVFKKIEWWKIMVDIDEFVVHIIGVSKIKDYVDENW